MKHSLIAMLRGAPVSMDAETLQLALQHGPEAALQARLPSSARSYTVADGVAIIPIMGVIAARVPEAFEEMGLGTSTVGIMTRVSDAAADPGVDSILLAVDSPGGSTRALPEAAEAIRAAREIKPVYAQVEYLAASAAYWLAAQASEIISAPSGDVGSIGVYTMHVDQSAALEKEGMKVTFIHAGQDKVLGNPAEPLSDRARDFIQASVDSAYTDFTNDVALGRRVDVATAKGESFGQGRAVSATDGLAAGLIDSIGTFGQTLARITKAPSEAIQGRSLDSRRRALALVKLRSL